MGVPLDNRKNARTSITQAARSIDAAMSAINNLADHEPVDFAAGDALQEAKRQLAIALGRI
jgi:hypothetical protein